jgi:hypothetical protein
MREHIAQETCPPVPLSTPRPLLQKIHIYTGDVRLQRDADQKAFKQA